MEKKKIKDAFFSIGTWLILILVFELLFKIFMGYKLSIESIINITLYSVALSTIFTAISRAFKEKTNNILTSIILLLLGLLFSLQCVFSKIFKTSFSLTNLALGGQLGDFIGETFHLIFSNIIYILVFFSPFVLFLFLRKRVKLNKNDKYNYIIYALIFVLSIGMFYLHLYTTKNIANGTYELYYKVNETTLNVQKLGVLNTYRLDFIRIIFGFEQEIKLESEEIKKDNAPIVYEYNVTDLNFEKETRNSDIEKINEYIKNDAGTQKNKYTGMFKNYNLIYITAESFDEIAISEELTPTLYRLTHSGFVFENFYSPVVLSTIGGEFQSITGLYPDSSILPTWKTGRNYFPYGLATVFKDLGYSTYAYHNHYYQFQDRDKYLLSQGFTNFLAAYNGLEKRMNCDLWPESDDEMIEATVPDYINDETPFLAYYMTVSGHMSYNFYGNAMSIKNKDAVQQLELSDEAKAYIATQIELDKALERLINELEAAGKLENTVIVLLADHYPYALSQSTINSLSTYERDDTVEINHNALILWNSKMESEKITKTCMSVDVLPTVLNLFGVNYDSRLLTGRDIFSPSEGIAVMRNYSWVSDIGTYFADTDEFVPKENIVVPENFIENINSIVKNRLNIARLIVKNDYYDYLFND